MTDSEYLEILENRRKSETERKKRKKYKSSETLCWRCENMCCSWIYSMIPVKNWTAEKTEIIRHDKNGDTILPSYFVYECPEFME